MANPNRRDTAYFPKEDAEPSIGALLLESEKISAHDAERILRHQKESGLRFGEAAVALKLVTESDIKQILARQFHYPYLQSGEGHFPEQLVAAYKPFSTEVENLRALRSQLMLRWFKLGKHGLAIIGLDKDDGAASLLISNLAVVFSQLGEQTLVVDGNLRGPRQQDIFNVKSRQGLSDILAQRQSEQAICRIEHFVNLSLLPAGTPAPNPHELLNRPVFAELNTRLTSSYDVVLYDTPAFGAASDSLAIATRVGGAVLVASKNRTRQRDVQHAVGQLRQSGIKAVGFVLMGA